MNLPNLPALRILDANANRAREALRVLEDYARFGLDDAALSAELKAIRHELAAALGGVLADAVLARDTAEDVGRTNKTAAELARADLGHVVTAAGKRLGEALRTLEEFSKIAEPPAAGRIESLRYRFYVIEQALARTLRPGERFRTVRLYVLITESLCRRPWMEAAEAAIAGGADCLQLREKSFDGGELLRRAKLLVELCRRRGTLCIINDRPDIAVLSGADGVHLGQEDLPAAEVRKIVGTEKIVGVSTHCIEQARTAIRDGADYIGVGPVFSSTTKPRDCLAGLEYAKQAASLPIATVAISGITAENAAQVRAAGVSAIAVSSAVISADDPQAAAATIKAALDCK